MGYLSPSDVPGVPETEAAELIRELEVHLSLHYLLASLDDAKAKSLAALMVPIIRRWAEAGTGLVTQEVTGPFTERRGGGGGHVLWKHEETLLRKLFGMADGSATSRGSFPPPEPIGDLFGRRPSWPRL